MIQLKPQTQKFKNIMHNRIPYIADCRQEYHFKTWSTVSFQKNGEYANTQSQQFNNGKITKSRHL